MHLLNVVVLSRSSIFAVGLVENLAGIDTVGKACVVDPTQDGAIKHLVELHPDAIIFDETDSDLYNNISTSEILLLVPTAILVKVSLGSDQVNIVTNLGHSALGIRNLIDVVQDLASQRPDVL